MNDTAPLTPDLLLRHEAFVLRLARSLVRDEASAQDVAQETLMAALRHAPPAGSLRGWLARVVRHRASDQRRGERRRAEREASTARPEAQPPTPTAAERLELEHGVVRAVLALDEPYRSVVVAVYYEGLTPSEVARRNGTAPGTVRAQLSRALDQLRGKLDHEHGDRATWGLALVGLLRSRESAALSASLGSVAGSTSSWPLAVAGAAVLGATLAAGAWWTVQGRAEVAPLRGLDGKASGSVGQVETTDVRRPADRSSPLEADVEQGEATTSASPAPALAELNDILHRARQVKTVLLERRLEVDPSLRARYAWLEALPDAGLARLIDRTSTGHATDLPWLQGGGSYFSFTTLDHDYQHRPQIGLENMRLCSGFWGGFQGVVVDLGEGIFRELALDPLTHPTGLSELQSQVLDVLRKPVDPPGTRSTSWLYNELNGLRIEHRALAIPGHTYVVRGISQDEFDVLVAFELPQVGADDCSLAWRVLQSWPVPGARPARPVVEGRAELSPLPEELLQREESGLRAELDGLSARAEELLFEDIPTAVRERYVGLSGRTDAGLTRMVDGASPWTELARVDGGGEYWSFATQSHDYQDDADLSLHDAAFEVRLPGADTGVVVDLGEQPLEAALVLPGQRGMDPALDFALWEEIDHSRPRDEVVADLRVLQRRAREVDGTRADAIVGHSYLVRTIVHEAHDLLAVFEVVDLDERGALIAWQIVRTWPVPQRR